MPTSSPGKIIAGQAEDFPVGSMTYFPHGHFYLSRLPEGFLALHEICTHLSCSITWEPGASSHDRLAERGSFHCPCHLYRFDRYGVAHGRQGLAPLNLLPVAVEDGTVVVGTELLRRRASYRRSQAVPAG